VAERERKPINYSFTFDNLKNLRAKQNHASAKQKCKNSPTNLFTVSMLAV